MKKYFLFLISFKSLTLVYATSKFNDVTLIEINSFTNNIPCAAAPTVILTNPTCSQSTGSITIIAVSGETYSLDGGNFSASLTYSGLLAGSSHTVLAKDSSGCISDPTIVTIISQPITPIAPEVSITYQSCNLATLTIINNIVGQTHNIDGGPYTVNTSYSNLTVGSIHAFTSKSAEGCISLTTYITIEPQNIAGISGTIALCESNPTIIDLYSIITNETSGGTWTRFSGTGGTFDAAAGTFTPVIGATTSSFMYTVTGTTPCPDDSSFATITINTTPNAGVLAGVQNICVGLTTSFTSTASGGVWSSANPAVATVNPVTGIVTGMSAGTATMTYTMNGIAPCVNDIATRTVTVNAQPEQPSIQGFQGICVGSWTVFTATPPGGTWSSSNNAVAMVDFTGFILGNSAGVSTISYTVAGSEGCADRTSVRNVTVSTAPTIALASAPNTANQTVCENTPITPIIYNIGTLNAQDAMAISLPVGVSGSYNAGVLTISGAPTASGTFPYSAVAVGPCGTDSLLGTITVNPSISTTMFCDPSGVISPNAVRIDWANIVGVTSFQYAYSIDNGPIVTGATNISHYEISGVLPGQSVTFTLTNVVGISCFQPVSVTCTNLANESFELGGFKYFPNPVTNILNITSYNPINTVIIINPLGQVICSKSYDSDAIQLDLSGFESGSYFCKVTSGNTSKTFKVVKE
jgi:hypothetical protein